MKLTEILRENTPDYVVYKVSSPNTNAVYYGYATGEENIHDTFLAGGKRHEIDRAEKKIIDLAGGPENLKFEPLEMFSDEIQAWEERNKQRDADPMSITKSSHYPPSVHARAQLDPAYKKRQQVTQLNMMRANDAMTHPESGYTYQDIKQLAATDPKLKQQMTNDLQSGMLYPVFKAKYFP
jgi:hypothetical protein